MNNPDSNLTTQTSQSEQLSRIQSTLDQIEKALNRLFLLLEGSAENPEQIELHLHALCNTVAGPGGQVKPGSMVITGPEAKSYLQALGEATIVPLKHMPPWTHMALADRAWWLLQMH